MCTSNSTRSSVWLRLLSGRLLVAKGWELRLWILCTQSTSFRGISLSPSVGHLLEPFSKASYTCFCVVSTFLVSSSMARGGGIPTMVMSKQTPILFLNTTPSQMTWLQQQPIILDSLLVCSRMWCCQCCLSRSSPCTICQGHWKTMQKIITQICRATIHYFVSRQFEHSRTTWIMWWWWWRWRYSWCGLWIWLKRKFLSLKRFVEK